MQQNTSNTDINTISRCNFGFHRNCAIPPQLEKCKALIAGKLKDLLESIARRLEANTSSAYCVGGSLTIADIMVSFFSSLRRFFLC